MIDRPSSYFILKQIIFLNFCVKSFFLCLYFVFADVDVENTYFKI